MYKCARHFFCSSSVDDAADAAGNFAADADTAESFAADAAQTFAAGAVTVDVANEADGRAVVDGSRTIGERVKTSALIQPNDHTSKSNPSLDCPRARRASDS